MSTIFLLMLSNVFMTFASYGHLEYGHDWPLWKAILVRGLSNQSRSLGCGTSA